MRVCVYRTDLTLEIKNKALGTEKQKKKKKMGAFPRRGAGMKARQAYTMQVRPLINQLLNQYVKAPCAKPKLACPPTTKKPKTPAKKKPKKPTKDSKKVKAKKPAETVGKARGKARVKVNAGEAVKVKGATKAVGKAPVRKKKDAEKNAGGKAVTGRGTGGGSQKQKQKPKAAKATTGGKVVVKESKRLDKAKGTARSGGKGKGKGAAPKTAGRKDGGKAAGGRNYLIG